MTADPQLPLEPKTDACWLWTAATTRGYGVFGTEQGPGKRSRTVRAHRLSYQQFVGAIPANQCVLHHCDNPTCVNPAHLYLGDRADNMRDCVTRGRHHYAAATHCKHGHAFTPDNTYRHPNGRRSCITCRRAYDRVRDPIRRATVIVALAVFWVWAIGYAADAEAHYRPGIHNTRHAINQAWCGRANSYCAASSQAWQVAGCETGYTYSVWANNGQYLGLFQMGDYARARYGHGWNPWAQANAAARYWRAAGWSPWECKP